MSRIKNIEGLSIDDLNTELSNGGRFVIFQYAYSCVVLMCKRSSDIYFIKAGESTVKYTIGYILVTILFGWWGLPWGPVYSVKSLFTNFSGGRNVTKEVVNSMNEEVGYWEQNKKSMNKAED